MLLYFYLPSNLHGLARSWTTHLWVLLVCLNALVPLACRLKLPAYMRVHNVFHVSKVEFCGRVLW